MGAIGFYHSYLIDDKSFLKTTIALMNQHIVFNDSLVTPNTIRAQSVENYTEGRLVLNSVYNRKINKQLGLKMGGTLSNLFFDLTHYKAQALIAAYTLFTNTNAASPSTVLGQAFVNLRYKASDKLMINGGVHAMYFERSKKTSIEPRLSVKYQIKDNQYWSLAYGLHGRVLPIGVYYNLDVNSTTNPYPNRFLDIMKTHHIVAAYDYIFPNNWRIHVEGYYQHLLNVPVSPDVNSSYSFLNEIQGFGDRLMVSKGKGRNFGIDFQVEKMFEKGTFLIASASAFRSLYTDISGKEHSTQYDSKFSSAVMAGKEWTTGAKGVFQISTKILLNGGLPITPLATAQTAGQFYPILDETQPYSFNTPTYFRPDVRVSYRHNGKKSAYTVALDVQNVALRSNQDGLSRNYDPTTNSWVYRKQSGLVPIISWKIDF
jgi:hypothetical protein